MRALILTSSALIMAGCSTPPEAAADPAPQVVPASTTAAGPQTQAEKFAAWKIDFTNRAIAKGYAPALVRRVIGGATINSRALDSDAKQPEFTRPVWGYIDSALSTDRVETGKTRMVQNKAVFDAVEARYRVPRGVLGAIWGMETSYGRVMGTHDTIDSLATFAHDGRRQKFGETQLFAVLDMLSVGYVRQDQLVGSWAGAVGMTQFIPATFRDYAVDFDGDGNKNLWTNESDALGSAAHYLSRMGWRAGEPAIVEVTVPENFDYSAVERDKKRINDWTALGVRPVNGQRWTAEAGFLEAKILAPAGHRGPKVLTFKNFDVIKRYNNSTSYALGIASLADELSGKKAITKPWPRSDQPISFEEKKQVQAKLTALGFDTGGVDGQIGPNSRRAIRAWQASQGLPADGYIEQRLLRRLLAQG